MLLIEIKQKYYKLIFNVFRYLRNNQLSGVIPKSIGNLSELVIM